MCCKVCFGSDSDLKNPLITPCKCSGTISYIHYVCLKNCLKAKVTVTTCTKQNSSQPTSVIYSWNNYYCEICHSDYPKYIKYKQTIYYLVDNVNNFEQYIQFDYRVYDETKKRNVSKGFIQASLPDLEEISIVSLISYIFKGRTHNNSIRLKDISVSRHHCSIVYDGGNLQLINSESKFGTLYYSHQPIILASNKAQVSLLAGNCLLKLEMTLKWSLLSLFSCCKSEVNDHEFEFGKCKGDENNYAEEDWNKDDATNCIVTNDQLNHSTFIQNQSSNLNQLQLFEPGMDDSLNDLVLNIENIIHKKDKADNNQTGNSFI